MSFKSNKSSSSSASTTNNTTSKPVTLQDVEGVTIAGNDGSTLLNEGFLAEQGASISYVETDADAVKSALQFAQNASDRALDFAFDAGRPEASITKQQVWALVAIAAVIFLAPMLRKG